ncbi:MAG: SDR family oxidoreductase [Elusimicrobia bacterium]|nr:SDR family oxidoreductase [Elusimicrobiota bacterium]
MTGSPRPLRCLVLGGTGHVGTEVCRCLARDGHRVAFTYRRSEGRAEALRKELPGAVALRAELTQFGDATRAVDDAARELGGLDALVQCAGSAGEPALYQEGADKFLSIGEQGWREMMDLTALSTFAAAQAACRAMPAGGPGTILIIGSMDGVKAVPAPVHYAAAKGALRAMTQALAQELGKRGIRVNMLAPGLLDGGVAKLLPPKLLDDYLKHCSLHRVGTAREVAEVAAWFVRDNTYVTGQTILLDGGL